MTTPTADFSPAVLALKFRRGDAVTLPVTIREDGALIDVSARAYLAQIRKSTEATDVLATFAVDTSSAAGGIVVATLAAEDTVDLKGDYVWDLEDTSTGRTLLGGKVTVEGDVSRAP